VPVPSNERRNISGEYVTPPSPPCPRAGTTIQPSIFNFRGGETLTKQDPLLSASLWLGAQTQLLHSPTLQNQSWILPQRTALVGSVDNNRRLQPRVRSAADTTAGSPLGGRLFFLFNHYSHATYLDHGEIMYSPFPVCCPCSGGTLQAPLCPPPRPVLKKKRSAPRRSQRKGKRV